MRFLFAALTVFAMTAQAQDFGAMGGGLTSGTQLSAEGHALDGLEEGRIGLISTVYRDEQTSFALIGRGERTRLNGRYLRFPKRNVDVPTEFGSADFGFSVNHHSPHENKYGLSATFGSAGTRLLENEYSPIVSATITWERPSIDGRSWIYFVNYSNNRPTFNNIPLPGFAYAIREKSRTLVFGLPFIFGNWRPDPWMCTVVSSPFVVMSEVGYRVRGPLQVFSGIGWFPRSYQNLVQGSDDRLIFDKKEANAGVRLFLGPQTQISLSYLYSFDRRFMLGESVLEENPDVVKLDDDHGAQLKLKFGF